MIVKMGFVACVILALLVGRDGYASPNEFSNLPTVHEFLSSPMTFENRIVGGEEADIEDHPYQASFIVNNTWFCGAFIVSDYWIVTAAHCLQNVDPKTVALRVGSAYRKNGTLLAIAETYAHPEYDQPAFDKDVAVMKTVEPIQFSETVQPIALPPKGRSMVGRSQVIVSGWGRTEQGANSIPDRLMSVRLPVVYYFECYLAYFGILTRNEWCGGNFIFGGKSTCQGDSGGAAVQDNYAVGIVSYGRGCGQPLSPSVFADIASDTIRDFIKKYTGL